MILIVLNFLLLVASTVSVGGGVVSLACYEVLNVISSFAIILRRKRELIILLGLCFLLSCDCLCSVSLLQTWSVHFLVIALAVNWLRVHILYSEQITYPYNQI